MWLMKKSLDAKKSISEFSSLSAAFLERSWKESGLGGSVWQECRLSTVGRAGLAEVILGFLSF